MSLSVPRFEGGQHMVINYCLIESISTQQALDLISWAGSDRFNCDVDGLLKKCGEPKTDEPLWILAHCDDGVTWGRFEGDAVKLSCSEFPRWPTPKPLPGSVQQLRIFGKKGELLIWRQGAESDQFSGRLLAASPEEAPENEPSRPLYECYILAANRLADGEAASPSGFTAVAEGNGRTQVVPLTVKSSDFGTGRYVLCLDVCHYFEVDMDNPDEATGSVRIAASRLIQPRLLDRKERVIGD